MDPNSEAASRLKSHTLFSSLYDEELVTLLQHCKVLDFDQHTRLFSQGEDANYFYYVIAGKFKLARVAPSGNEKVIEIIGPGETIAEALLFMEQQKYPVTAEALTPGQVVAIRGQAYMSILKGRSDLCFNIMGSLCVRLHQRLQEIERLSLQNATDRLIHYLATHSPPDVKDGHELVLDIPKRVLASRLSMLPETFSRVLHKLVDEQVIDVRSRKIIINNVERLHEYYPCE
ncbi:MAG: Crp/Fnr family transcriptional regulator [Ketobacteraceae bacterium]|nr:Crp/Fnr family transcriptional regulator [Ketobacteraceae bacterium]